MHEQREPLGAALASLSVDIKPFSAEEYDAISQRLVLLRLFHQATIELSEEKRVSGSEAMSPAKMLKHFIASQCGQMDQGIGATKLNE